jgi:hypothetical protein
MKLSKFGSKLSLPCPFFSFPERFQPITAAVMCTVTINVLEPGAFNAEFQYFIPLFNTHFITLRITARGDEASQMAGETQAQTGHEFPDNSNICFLFFTMRTEPFSEYENRSGSHIARHVRT